MAIKNKKAYPAGYGMLILPVGKYVSSGITTGKQKICKTYRSNINTWKNRNNECGCFIHNSTLQIVQGDQKMWNVQYLGIY